MGISMNGFDELIIAFDELSEMPDSVLDGMLEAGAKVVERVTRETGISIHAPAKGATAILYNKFHFLCIILYILSAIT